jgi:hypothetical protein
MALCRHAAISHSHPVHGLKRIEPSVVARVSTSATRVLLYPIKIVILIFKFYPTNGTTINKHIGSYLGAFYPKTL